MKKSIFVGNIPYGALEAEIKSLFGRFGKVLDVHFCMDWQKGKFRGFGFVTMPPTEADKAIQELNGCEFQGRSLKVSEAQAKADEGKTQGE